jgi:hypothetical protein
MQERTERLFWMRTTDLICRPRQEILASRLKQRKDEAVVGPCRRRCQDHFRLVASLALLRPGA